MDQVLLTLAIIFFAGFVGGELAEWAKVPAVAGEITAGIIIGPAILGLVDPASPHSGETIELLAELGVIFLLFITGLETGVGGMREAGPMSLGVAGGGIVVPFVLGAGVMILLNRPVNEALFVGTALVATSVGVTARVFEEMGTLSSRPAKIVLGAAVVDDVLGLMLLAGVVAYSSQSGSLLVTGISLAVALLILVAVLTLGRTGLRKSFPFLAKLKASDPVLGVAVVTALLLAGSLGRLGLAPIIGAFAAGVLFAEVADQTNLRQRLTSIAFLLTPIFFVRVGTLIGREVFTSGSAVGLMLLLTLVAIVGKVAGCGLPARKLGRKDALIVGVGMMPRGEVGIVVASLGLAAGVVGFETYSVIAVVCLVTTLLAPPVLVWLQRGASSAAVKS